MQKEAGNQKILHQSGGRACLVVIAGALGMTINEEELQKKHGIDDELTDFTTLKEAAEKIELKVKFITMENKKLYKVSVPAIAMKNDGGYIVIQEINKDKIRIYDPAYGHSIIIRFGEFVTNWSGKVIVFKRAFSLKDLGRQFNLTWFIPIIIKYKQYFMEIIGAAFFFQLFGLVSPLCTQVIIDKVIIHQGTVTLNVLAVGMVFVVLFQATMNVIRTYLFTHTTNKIDIILGTRIFRHLMNLPIQYFEKRLVGDILLKVSALNNIREFLTNTAINACIDLIFTVLFFAVMFYYSIPLTLIAIAAIPIQVIINILGTPLYQNRLKESWNVSAESNAFLVESIMGMYAVKSLSVEPQFKQRWESLLAKSVSRNLDKTQLSVLLNNGVSLTQQLVTYLIIWYGGIMVIDGAVTIGQFIAFQMLANQASAPLSRLAGIWQSFQQTKLAVQRIGDILNAVPEPKNLAEAVELQKIKGEIEFKNVTFRYVIDDNPVLKKINLNIKPGMKVGIVGRSGSGKSTLTKIIQKLYTPEAGNVYIDGLDIDRVDLMQLRQQIGVVLQDNYLFNGSVRDNIALTRQVASMKEINQAARLAGAHEFILELPEGYDTMIGERGSTLSGGQRQRIAIARVLLTNPQILIFDEATSALDYQSERLIMGNMDCIAAGRTMLIIAHRLSNVVHCDVIIVMEHGEIVEQGTHHELMNQKGTYYHLHNQQGGRNV